MKNPKRVSNLLSTLGTLTCTLSLATLFTSILTPDWLSLQEPTLDASELEKLGPYDDDPKPEVLKAKLGLLKTCTQLKLKQNCIELNIPQIFANFHVFEDDKGQFFGSELVLNCVNKMRLSLPFISLSLVFTSAAFLTATFGHFCSKNRKIIQACNLIMAGLCQATALLTFVAQIGSEFESSNNGGGSENKKHFLLNFFRYKYGYSFYLFLLSFSLAELAALLSMVSYFRKNEETHHHLDFEMTEKEMQPDICHDFSDFVPPPQSYLSPEVVVVANNFCTVSRNTTQQVKRHHLESFATLRSGQNFGELNNL